MLREGSKRLARRALLVCVAMIGIASTAAEAQTGRSVTGVVTAAGEPVIGAEVEVRGTALKAVTDGRGAFRLDGVGAGAQTLRVTAIGYERAERGIEAGAEAVRVAVVLRSSAFELDPIVVTGTMKQTYVSESPVKVDVVSGRLLQRLATNSLMASIQHINGLYEQIDCGVCYTNNIRINGMEGPYTAVLIDGMPIMSSLASVYGLNGINPALVERLEIVKGPSSTLYGTEAMAGVVNVITKDPRFAARATLDGYRSSDGETNLEFAFAPGAGPVRALVSGSLAHNDRFIDENADGFTDVPLATRAAFFGKAELHRDAWRVAGLTAKAYYEDRFGGVSGWSEADRGSTSVYGESIETRRVELLGTWSPSRASGVRADASYTWHDQDSWYGASTYMARQSVAFANLLWSGRAGDHDLLVGGTVRWQSYDDDTPATAEAERRFIPGVIVQDEVSLGRTVDALGGLRLDHHAEHGVIASPRASVLWRPFAETAFRVNAGTGFRVVNLFTEDHAALTGAREVVIAEALRPERSYSVAFNANQVIDFGTNPMMVDVDAFHTRFTNKIVPDYDADPGVILYDNLRGHSVSRGIGLSLNQNFSKVPLLYTVGITFQDVYAVEDGVRTKELFAPEYKGVFSASYTFPPGLTVDYSGTLVGPMRLPRYAAPFERPTRSSTYSLHNVKASYDVRSGVTLYAAVNNLFDFTQGSPLIDPAHPFGDHFDTAYVWAPIRGRVVLAGLRLGVSR